MPTVVDDRDPVGVAARQREVAADLHLMARVVDRDRDLIRAGVVRVRTGGAERLTTASQLLLAALLERVERGATSGEVRRAARAFAAEVSR